MMMRASNIKQAVPLRPSQLLALPTTRARLPGRRSCSNQPHPSPARRLPIRHGHPPPRPRLRVQPAAGPFRLVRRLPLRRCGGPPLPPRPRHRRGRRQSPPAPLQDPPFPPRPTAGALPGNSSAAAKCGAGLAPRVAPALARPRGGPRRVRIPGRARQGAAAYWAVDVSEGEAAKKVGGAGAGSAFVELRTLMVATDWSDKDAMGELAIAGHARALLEWHSTAKFCGACGAKAVPTEAVRRKQCSNESCKKRIYPRVDPVVIMLVIDKENDRALLSRQSKFVPRMWSCLAGFIEPGESLEEAVRRETWEETGIEVGQVIYHSSQPWPVGPNTMPCQLMVGFFAYAKSLEIHVDKQELEDAQWHSREDIKRALTFAEYEKAQRTNASRSIRFARVPRKDRASLLTSEWKVMNRCSSLGPLQLLITLFLRGLWKEHPRCLVPSQIFKPRPYCLD